MGVKLKIETDIQVKKVLRKDSILEHEAITETPDCVVLLDLRQDEALRMRGEAREIINRVQRQKKLCRVKPEDDIVLFYELGPGLQASLEQNLAMATATIKKPFLPKRYLQRPAIGCSEQLYQGKETLNVYLSENLLFVDNQALGKEFGEVAGLVSTALKCMRLETARGKVQDGRMKLTVEGKQLCLQEGRHFFLGAQSLMAAKK